MHIVLIPIFFVRRLNMSSKYMEGISINGRQFYYMKQTSQFTEYILIYILRSHANIITALSIKFTNS